MRQVESTGGFATIVQRGDPDSGALVLIVAERGVPHILLERRLSGSFDYRWTATVRSDPSHPEKFRDSVKKITLVDADCWLIELDVADAERFIAETIGLA